MQLTPAFRSFRKREILSAAAVLATLFLLGLTVFSGHVYLKSQLRQQLLVGNGQLISAILRADISSQIEDPDGLRPDFPADQLAAVLEATRLSEFADLLGVRLFTAEGEFLVAIPYNLADEALSAQDLASLNALEPVVRFLPANRIENLFLPQPDVVSADFGKYAEGTPIPVEVLDIPLYDQGNKLLGIAQFVLLGDRLAAEFASLDRQLTSVSIGTFVVTGALTAIVLLLVFRKLHRNGRALTERTEMLTGANRELAVMAKTSAMGALTSHLVESLLNPLSELHESLLSSSCQKTELASLHLGKAVNASCRMRSMVNEVVHVLNEIDSLEGYDVHAGGLVQVVALKVAPLMDSRCVAFTAETSSEVVIPNRRANLVMLILVNLVRSTLQESPGLRALALAAQAAPGGVAFEVECEFMEEADARMPGRNGSAENHGSRVSFLIIEQLAKQANSSFTLKFPSVKTRKYEVFVPVSCQSPLEPNLADREAA